MDTARDTSKRQPQRTCLATGEVKHKDNLVRFVLSPEGALLPDVAERLPGRGVWVTATRSAVETAIKKQAFSRGFKQPVKADSSLPAQVESMLLARVVHWLALANKCGEAVLGFTKVEAALKEGRPALVLLASDAGASDQQKIQSLAGKNNIEVCTLLSREALAKPFGRDDAVHIAMLPGGIVQQMQKEIRRLAGFCTKVAL
jgi:predicted RNA-binding protein YlxR (DUF448 family)